MSDHECDLPSARLGALARCAECETLWRRGRACATCDYWGPSPHPGQHVVGAMWRPTTIGQGFLARLKGI